MLNKICLYLSLKKVLTLVYTNIIFFSEQKISVNFGPFKAVKQRSAKICLIIL